MMNNFFLPFRGVFCRVSPVAFDGTLSFLELLNKLQYYLNETINNLNNLETALENFEQYVETALDGKQDVLSFDAVPTDGSTNPVESNGIYDALATKQDVLTFDTVPTDGSTNPVESNGIYDALATKQDVLTFDSVPTLRSQNPVTSGGVYDAIATVNSSLSAKILAINYDVHLTGNDINSLALPNNVSYNDIRYNYDNGVNIRVYADNLGIYFSICAFGSYSLCFSGYDVNNGKIQIIEIADDESITNIGTIS